MTYKGSRTSLVRDAAGRVVSRTVDPAGDAPAVTKRYLYAGAGDSPVAVVSADASSVWMLSLPGGVTVDVPSAGASTWAYPSLQGHTLTTGDGTTSTGVQLYDPFGQPLDAATLAIGTAAANASGVVDETSGWHQGAQKLVEATEDTLIVEMGARLYVPTLGRFLQVDPAEGGVDNDYVWPTDPIGKNDLSGSAEEWRGFLEGAAIFAGVVGAVACAASVVCGVAGAVAIGVAAGAAAYVARDGFSDRFSAGGLAVNALAGALPGGVVTTGIRSVAARVVARAVPAGSAAFKRDSFHRVGGWVASSITRRGAIRPVRVAATRSWGLSVSVRAQINGRAGTQNWVVGRGRLVHSHYKYN